MQSEHFISGMASFSAANVRVLQRHGQLHKNCATVEFRSRDEESEVRALNLTVNARAGLTGVKFDAWQEKPISP